MEKQKRSERDYPFPERPFVDPCFGEPESCADLVNKYGTYNIQPTAETENTFPLIAHGLARKQREMRIGRDALEKSDGEEG